MEHESENRQDIRNAEAFKTTSAKISPGLNFHHFREKIQQFKTVENSDMSSSPNANGFQIALFKASLENLKEENLSPIPNLELMSLFSSPEPPLCSYPPAFLAQQIYSREL